MSGQLVWGTSNHNFTVHRQSRYSDKKVGTSALVLTLSLSTVSVSLDWVHPLSPREDCRGHAPLPAGRQLPSLRPQPAPLQRQVRVLDNTFNICTERSQD